MVVLHAFQVNNYLIEYGSALNQTLDECNESRLVPMIRKRSHPAQKGGNGLAREVGLDGMR
jgi:hypothetical protein